MLACIGINYYPRKVFWWVEEFQSGSPSVVVEDRFGIQALWLHMQTKAFMVGVKEAHGQVQQI
jgi:hypothetical protein